MRRPFMVALMILPLLCGLASRAAGQAPPPQPQAPTTVQLPTFRFFTVNTTVSVPDRGAAYLGGLSGARDTSSTRGLGPLRSRSTSSGRSASMMSVYATIIDHAELDRAVLAEAASRRGATAPDASAVEADYLSANIRRAAATSAPDAMAEANTPPLGSVAEIRRQAALRAEQRDAETAAWLAKAESLEAEGKPNVAKIYYQMIARRATGDLKATAEARITLINTTGSSATVIRPQTGK
jgi:hypothetical protein